MTQQKTLSCMICGDELSSSLLYATNTHGRDKISEERFFVYFCSRCLTYQSPVVQDQAYYQKYYDSLDYYGGEKANTVFLKIEEFWSNVSFFLRILFLPGSREKRKWLDVGAGDGSFLQRLSRKKFEGVGVEISSRGYEKIRQKNIRCYHGSFENIDFKGEKFDCVSFWHVLEHCNQPRLYIEKACHLLNEGGLLIVGVPCAESFGFRWGREKWFHLDAPRHVFWPTEKTLLELTRGLPLFLKKKIVPWWEYPLDLWWSVGDLSLPKRWFVRLLYPFLKMFDKETMIFVFQKKDHGKGKRE